MCARVLCLPLVFAWRASGRVSFSSASYRDLSFSFSRYPWHRCSTYQTFLESFQNGDTAAATGTAACGASSPPPPRSAISAETRAATAVATSRALRPARQRRHVPARRRFHAPARWATAKAPRRPRAACRQHRRLRSAATRVGCLSGPRRPVARGGARGGRGRRNAVARRAADGAAQ